MNLVFLALWIISAEAVFRVARRLTGSAPAALVAGPLWTYSTIRLGQYGHFQLALGALIPMTVLLLWRLFDDPRWWRGVVLAVTWAVCTLCSSYYGLGLGLLIAITMLLQLTGHRDQWRRYVIALTAAAVTAAVLVGPVAIRYLELQRDPAFRHGYEDQFALRWDDFRAPQPSSVVWSTTPHLDHRPRSSERPAYLGVITGLSAAVGLMAIVRRRARLEAGRATEFVGLVIGGAVLLGFALGHHLTVNGSRFITVSDFFIDHVPGFSAVRAIARLAVFAQLAVVSLSAIGLAWLFTNRRREVVTAMVAVLVSATAADSALHLTFTRVPTESADGASNRWLVHQPAGTVLELPIPGPQDGAPWAFAEAPRMVLAAIDGHQRFNGYSGFTPPGYIANAGRLNTFPSADAVALARQLKIRYVVAHTKAYVSELPSIDAAALGAMKPAQADAVAAGAPSGSMVVRLADAVVIDLGPQAK
jgi:hypothetical protein